MVPGEDEALFLIQLMRCRALFLIHQNKVHLIFFPRSAPEILLSIVGIIFNDFKQDELGPSLIVGSGAFNLLVISAIRNNLIFLKIDKYFT